MWFLIFIKWMYLKLFFRTFCRSTWSSSFWANRRCNCSPWTQVPKFYEWANLVNLQCARVVLGLLFVSNYCRYRISGTSLLAAMQRGSQDALSAPVGELSPQINGINDDASSSTSDDRTGLVHPTVDVTEILRRWTHALQRIHKQSLYLVSQCCGSVHFLLL